MSAALPDLQERLPQEALDLLSGADGRYSEWATASAVAMFAMNAGYTEDEFVRLVSESDFAYRFATEDHGRDRSNRLESRLRKVWDKAEYAWNPPLREVPDVRERLESLSQRVAAHKWTGRTASKDRAVAVALVQWAHEVGTWTLDAGTRELGMRSGVAHSTAKRALHRLAAIGLISRDQDTQRQGTHSKRWVLDMQWGIRDELDPHDLSSGGRGLCGLNTSLNHPVFLGSALGQTAERIWLDLANDPQGSTAREIADRIGGDPKTIRTALDTKLVANRLVTVSSLSSGRGRPAKVYRLDPSAGRALMDEIAESFGAFDWHERTAERYERERAGYRDVQRQQAEREDARFRTAWKPAEDGWWLPDPWRV
jgi:DNA-binding PadR family transcriptional regulator